MTSLENTTANAYQALSIQPPAAPRARGGAAQAIVPAARSRAEVIAFNAQADHFSSPLVVFCNAEVLATRAARMAAKACAHTSLGSAGLYGDAEAELSTVSTAGRPSQISAVTVPKRAESRHSLGDGIGQHLFQHSSPQVKLCAIKRPAGLVSTSTATGSWRLRLRQAVALPWLRSTQAVTLSVYSAARALQPGKIRMQISALCTSCSALCARTSSAAWGPHTGNNCSAA